MAIFSSLKSMIKDKTDVKPNRDLSLDAVKGFAIILVMIGHCIVLNELADPYVYDAINAIQMPLFMAVSGYIVGLKRYDFQQKPDAKKSLKALGKRSVSYLVPFFTWMIIVSFPHCLQELKTELFHLDYGLWFLATLWIITVVSSVAAFIADYAGFVAKVTMQGKMLLRFLVYACIVGGCYIGFFLQGRSENTFLSPSLTVRYMPFYVVAYVFAYYALPVLRSNQKKTGSAVKVIDFESAKEVKNRNRAAGMSLSVISALVFAYLIYVYDTIIASDLKMVVIQMIASFLGTFACFYLVKSIKKGKIQSILAFIGQFTLEIYVLHFRFARLLRLPERNLVPFRWNTILWIIATFVIMSICTSIMILILKCFALTDFLCFGKIRPRKRK